MARGTFITRTTKKGKKKYYTALWAQKPNGGRKQICFDLKKQAEDYLDQQSHEIRQGDYFEPTKITFADFAASGSRSIRSLQPNR